MKDIGTKSGENPTLDEVCEFIVDCLHKTAPTQSTGYPSIRTPNVGRGRLMLEGVNRVSEDVYAEWAKRAIPDPGDLIMAREAPAGNVAIIGEGQTVCLGQRTVHLRPDREKVDPDFLCYYLLAPRQQGALLAGETGATARHVNMRDIRRLKLGSLPTVPTQQKLGQIIAAYDDLIENNRRRIALLEEAARLLYREWFVHFRFPGHEHVKVIDGIPIGWEQVRVADKFDTTAGGTPSRKHPDFFRGNINWVKTQELNERPIFETSEKITEEAIARSSAKSLPGQTLLVAIYGNTNIGRTGLLALPGSSNQACVALLPKRRKEDWIYAQLWLQQHREQIVGLAQGSAQTNISQETLRGLTMIWPTDLLLDDFLDSVLSSYQQIECLCLQNSKLAQARDILLPHLMNGEITI